MTKMFVEQPIASPGSAKKVYLGRTRFFQLWRHSTTLQSTDLPMASPLFVRVPWLQAVRYINIQCSVQCTVYTVHCAVYSALLVSLLHNLQ